MNSIYVLNRALTLQGIVDEYESLIWRPAYSDVGDFEIYVKANADTLTLLQKDFYVVRSSDISVNEGITTYKSVMVIKNIKLTTDIEDGAYLTVTGRELKYLLHQRIVWQQTTLKGTAEDGIRTLVTQNAISPTDTRRAIPDLVLGASSGLADSIKKQITGAYLDEAIAEICATYNYGWDMYITDGKLTVIVYKGLDRSYAQTERPYVVFSEYFDNLYSTEYELNSEAYANTTLIGGEGEGLDRITTTLGAANSGLDRYEVFTDAKDVSQNKGNEDEIAPADYLLLLEEKGRETLSGLVMTEGFTGEVLSDVTFKWRKDFNLGDVVTVISQYGLSRNVRVMSAIESEDSDGAKLLPVFNL